MSKPVWAENFVFMIFQVYIYIYICLDLYSDINFCFFNIICLKGMSDRKSDCGRNLISTIGNIEILYFWEK